MFRASRRRALVGLSSALLLAPTVAAVPAHALTRGSPVGSFDSASPRLGAIRVHGWMLDPNTAASGYVRVSVDGRVRYASASRSRVDVARRFPGYGSRHGFDATLSASVGTHRVCVSAPNRSGPGSTTRLGCRTVTVSGRPGGHLNTVSTTDQGVQVSGWAIDPDTSAPVRVHVYVDGAGRATLADMTRTDVGAAYPRYGARHGFRVAVPASAGDHKVCAYALNAAGSGTTTPLGCQRTAVPSFDDEFNGTTLDTGKWSIYETAVNSFHSGDECYNRANVSVANGTLRLTATKSATSQQCTSTFASPYQSGMISSKGKFAQTYGHFEMRAKFPPGIGFQPAFWMLPENAVHTDGFYYGEIDVVEAWGNYPNIVSPHLHYVYTPGTPIGGAYYPLAGTATSFHTYRVDWSSTRMTFRYDGKVAWTTTWQPGVPNYAPTGATSPAPFDQPFYLMLELAMGGDSTASNRATDATPFPSTMYIDYVRVWK